MATILAYTSPALGHMLPISALLSEVARRGHTIHLRTLSTAIDMGAGLGFETSAIDPRIEDIPLGDGGTADPRRALQIGVAAFGRRAAYEVTDLAAAIAGVAPDALLIGVNCWGARSATEAGHLPWACFSPYTPPLRSPGVPPFGLGLKPMHGVLGRARDAVVQAVISRTIERVMLPSINQVRTDVGLPPVATADEYLRRAPLLLVATGKPFQYEQTEWGDAIHMIGPCALDPFGDSSSDWLAEIDRPIVLVTTSSEPQADAELVSTAIAALADEPVHVVATVPTGPRRETTTAPNATVCGAVPHEAVLARAVCAITHGGMGATQKALLRGVPVCVVPFGRDQFEVARRVEVARCGTRLPAKKLSAPRLRTKVRQAMTMTEGVKRVAAGFAATGGTARGADLFEQLVVGGSSH
ncbi:glycosyltransferase [Mycolicibacterium sp. GF69]|uniref:nucleotide disphospho-sugar-binding domain-containing protein n=1 Tax=Mycolicibacterium sp. GF69 TaxID=2267251 RepID=UPI000DCD55C1|nr:nucleotide disphospho-sugar-binding domain-containing protein [Mycolicibacterium sp. GF69]RAV18107.1 glycosyltransferase [Mycolicibacterium sp. GF69]